MKACGVLLGPVDDVPGGTCDGEPVLLLAAGQDLAGLDLLLDAQARGCLERPQPGEDGLQVDILRVEDASSAEVDLLRDPPGLLSDWAHPDVTVHIQQVVVIMTCPALS